MRTTKYFLFVGLGVAAVLLLTSDKAKEIRDGLEERTKRTAKNWKDRLKKIGRDTTDSFSELKEILDGEAEGFSDKTRDRIENLLNTNPNSAHKIKKVLISRYPELIFYL